MFNPQFVQILRLPFVESAIRQAWNYLPTPPPFTAPVTPILDAALEVADVALSVSGTICESVLNFARSPAVVCGVSGLGLMSAGMVAVRQYHMSSSDRTECKIAEAVWPSAFSCITESRPAPWVVGAALVSHAAGQRGLATLIVGGWLGHVGYDLVQRVETAMDLQDALKSCEVVPTEGLVINQGQIGSQHHIPPAVFQMCMQGAATRTTRRRRTQMLMLSMHLASRVDRTIPRIGNDSSDIVSHRTVLRAMARELETWGTNLRDSDRQNIILWASTAYWIGSRSQHEYVTFLDDPSVRQLAARLNQLG